MASSGVSDPCKVLCLVFWDAPHLALSSFWPRLLTSPRSSPTSFLQSWGICLPTVLPDSLVSALPCMLYSMHGNAETRESGNTVGRQIPQDWRKEVGEERGLVRRRGQKEDRARWGASQKTKQRTLHGSETPLDAIAMFLWSSRPQSVILRHSDH